MSDNPFEEKMRARINEAEETLAAELEKLGSSLEDVRKHITICIEQEFKKLGYHYHWTDRLYIRIMPPYSMDRTFSRAEPSSGFKWGAIAADLVARDARYRLIIKQREEQQFAANIVGKQAKAINEAEPCDGFEAREDRGQLCVIGSVRVTESQAVAILAFVRNLLAEDGGER